MTSLNLQAMIARLVLALLVTGTVVTLGIWANTGPEGLFAWLTTAITGTVALLTSGALRRMAVAPRAASRLAAPIEILRTHPHLRILATDRAARVGVAIVFGLLLASAASGVSAGLLAGIQDANWRAALSLTLVGIPAWTLVGLASRPDPDTFGARLARAVGEAAGIEARDLGRVGGAIGWAVLRTAGTVIVRAVALLAFPLIFSNQWAIAFFALVAITVITGGDVLLELAHALRRPATDHDASGAVHVVDETPIAGPRVVPAGEGSTPQGDPG